MLYHFSIKHSELFKDVQSISLLPSGKIGLASKLTITTQCKFDLKKYPFDVQHCELVLTMVKHSRKQVNFSDVELILTEYKKRQSGQFELTSDGLVTDIVDFPFLDPGLHQVTFKFKVTHIYNLSLSPYFLIVKR